MRKSCIARYAAVAIILLLIGAAAYGAWIWPRGARPAIGDPAFAPAADGARIAYYVSGPADGRVAVLLASLGRSVSDFNELAEALNVAGYRMIAMEMRGVGRSAPATDQEFTLYDLSGDGAVALDHTCVAPDRTVDIIGRAFGNRLARAFAPNIPIASTASSSLQRAARRISNRRRKHRKR